MSRLDLKGLTKSYKSDTVVDNVSLSVDSGETLVLFGPSGAGKTVLLRLIAGVVEPDSGSVEIDQEDVALVEAEHRGLGMAFQNFALFPHMQAFDNIASPLHAARLSKHEVAQRVDAVARLLKIEHVLSHMPKELSNGQKQRTALARALVGEPPIVLLDDPLRNVDAKLRFEMRLELPSLLRGRGTTVVYVTQDYKEAMALGDNIAVLTEGSVVQHGSPEDIYLRPNNIKIARLFGDPVINCFSVTPEMRSGSLVLELSGAQLHLRAHDDSLSGKECVLGIRPEHVHFVSADTPGAMRVNVVAETPVNEKIITLATTSGGREMLVSRPSKTAGPDSGEAYLEFKEGSSLLFDKSSGALLSSQAHSSTKEEYS